MNTFFTNLVLTSQWRFALLWIYVFTMVLTSNAITCLAAEKPAVVKIYFVSPSGSDKNPGTEEIPFQTIQHAQMIVRKEIQAGLKNGIQVILRGGTYRITKPLEFTNQDSGNQKFRITYAAYKNEKPVISGGREIKAWKKLPNGNFQTFIPDVKSGRWTFRKLYVNSQESTRARHPNRHSKQSYLRVVAAGPDNRTSFSFNQDDFKLKDSVGNIELVFLHDWSISRVNLKSIDHKNHIMSLASSIGCKAKHYRINHFEKHPRYFLENDISFLDAPGEWFLDVKTGTLTYRPQQGEKVSSLKVVAPLSESLLTVRGTESAPVQNLHFQGITFQHCAFRLPKYGYAAGQAGFHETRDDTNWTGFRRIMKAAITFENAVGCQLQSCTIKDVDGSGISFGRGCKSCSLNKSIVSNVGGNGVMIGETTTKWITTKNELKNNLIEKCGKDFYGCIGVWVGMANYTTIAHNTIRKMPYTGISVGWRWNPTPTPCHHNIIEHNNIHHVMQILSDGGGIYTLGKQPGTILRHNKIHDISLNAGRAESNGMFLDEGTTDILVEKNNIYNIQRSPLRFHKAGRNIVSNNRLVVRKGIPHIRYNNTKPADITQIDNEIIVSEKKKEK